MRGDKAVLFFFVAAAILGTVLYESEFTTKAIAWLLLLVVALFFLWRRDMRGTGKQRSQEVEP
jgi:membrane protein implicated in regulation of membrane protease activity